MKMDYIGDHGYCHQIEVFLCFSDRTYKYGKKCLLFFGILVFYFILPSNGKKNKVMEAYHHVVSLVRILLREEVGDPIYRKCFGCKLKKKPLESRNIMQKYYR